MKGIGIIPGYRPHYLDHLIPLCQLMHIPLLITDPLMHELAQCYYPTMEIILCEQDNYCLDEALSVYDVFFYVDFSRKGNGSFQFHEYISKKKVRSVISLHGNPDKYSNVYWLEKLCDEDIVLAYGPQLVKQLQEKRIDKQPIICGNYRLEYYIQHAHFFDSKLPFKKERQIVLYAPTWTSKEKLSELRGQYSSFFNVYAAVFEKLMDQFQLLVKLHPLMVKSMPDEVEKVKECYPDVFFLDDFPLIYPLLKYTDIYLGDFSSIGYDFLFFDRPLYFLEPPEITPLHACGKIIRKEELPHLSQIHGCYERKKNYNYAFGEKKELGKLKSEIEYALQNRSNFN